MARRARRTRVAFSVGAAEGGSCEDVRGLGVSRGGGESNRRRPGSTQNRRGVRRRGARGRTERRRRILVGGFGVGDFGVSSRPGTDASSRGVGVHARETLGETRGDAGGAMRSVAGTFPWRERRGRFRNRLVAFVVVVVVGCLLGVGVLVRVRLLGFSFANEAADGVARARDVVVFVARRGGPRGGRLRVRLVVARLGVGIGILLLQGVGGEAKSNDVRSVGDEARGALDGDADASRASGSEVGGWTRVAYAALGSRPRGRRSADPPASSRRFASSERWGWGRAPPVQHAPASPRAPRVASPAARSRSRWRMSETIVARRRGSPRREPSSAHAASSRAASKSTPSRPNDAIFPSPRRADPASRANIALPGTRSARRARRSTRPGTKRDARPNPSTVTRARARTNGSPPIPTRGRRAPRATVRLPPSWFGVRRFGDMMIRTRRRRGDDARLASITRAQFFFFHRKPTPNNHKRMVRRARRLIARFSVKLRDGGLRVLHARRLRPRDGRLVRLPLRERRHERLERR